MTHHRAFRSASAERRLSAARDWLAKTGRAREVLIVTPHTEAGTSLVARSTADVGATFGWTTITLGQLASTLSRRALAQRGIVAVSALAAQAVCATVVHRLLAREALGRFTPVAHFPGLPRALARTFSDLRMGAVAGEALADADLARALAAYEEELARGMLCDRADVFREATDLVSRGDPHDLLGRPVLFVDVRIESARERELCAAICARAEAALVTVVEGDLATERNVTTMALPIDHEPAEGPLAHVQRQLFSREPVTARSEEGVLTLLSAPGESRECIEIVRRIRDEALRGVPFDRMAVLLRAPAAYQAHLVEAMRRGKVQAYFARGTPTPDPSGRAMLALVACAIEGLSAARFSEYLSLGELPNADALGAPPRGGPIDRVPPDDETISLAAKRAQEESPDEEDPPSEEESPDSVSVVAGSLRAPRHWERIIVDAAVIGGIERWRERLQSLDKELQQQIAGVEEGELALRERLIRDHAAVVSLSKFAMPMLEALDALPKSALWGEWIDKLSDLAQSALRKPERVQRVLAELAPMRDVGPVTLAQARLVLEPRLGVATERPTGRRQGRVFVGSADDARGCTFDVVFVPGLAERVFPQKISQDPILMDDARAAVGATLATNAQRAEDERLALRLAIGAATCRVVVTYPRLDLDQARPRTPSFYALDLIRASMGALPSYSEIAERANAFAGARIGWPAPETPQRAIDEAEYDLAILDRILRKPEGEAVGSARYLLHANDHLERGLRARWMRWDSRKWEPADGLVSPSAEGLEALAAHKLAARSFSPTALQHFASCPYRFLLQAVHRLAPLEEPIEIEELNPLQKGSLMHETIYETLCALRDAGLLPVTQETHEQARKILDEQAAKVAASFRAELKPAIERVWLDAVAQIKTDLAEWLKRMFDEREESSWVPTYFELSFGLTKDKRAQQDPNSSKDPVDLPVGIRLRGSIDLVERHVTSGKLRATDFKSGKVRAKDTTVIGGGKTLQPVLYALTIEQMLAGAAGYEGRLYYCTSVGGYRSFTIPLDAVARDEAKIVSDTVGAALEQGFLPAAPGEGECEWCDYRTVCGPYEEQRTKHKNKQALAKLIELRRRS